MTSTQAAVRAGTLASLIAMVTCTQACSPDPRSDSDDDSAPTDDDDSTPTDDDDSSAPQQAEDVFDQTAQPVDILFVVDNSCSMEEEQAALSDHFMSLFEHLDGVDYHIGITVLDDWSWQPPIGELYGNTPIIDPSNPDPVAAFSGNMTMGGEGYGICEVGLEAIYRALTEPLLSGVNAGFYREQARLSLIVVSDEEDKSVDGCEAITQEDFIPWLSSLKSDGLESIQFTGIVGDWPLGCTSSWGEAESGEGYHDVISSLGPDHASFHSICAQDWTPAMDGTGQASLSPELYFELEEVPLEGTIRAFLDLDGPDNPEEEFEVFEDPTYQLEFAFEYLAGMNMLAFHPSSVPPLGSQLRVTYQPSR